MSKKSKDMSHLWVWLDDSNLGERRHIGNLNLGDRGSIRFSYEKDWIKDGGSFDLDPHLRLSEEEFYPKESNFGVFLDSCPDRWGRLLMDRREAVMAADESRAKRTLGAWEYLLGVQDMTRMGALRFTLAEEETFLSDEALAAPPITKLAELEELGTQLSRRDINDLSLLKKWLKVLVAPGSSLGGARPKANLSQEDGSLWIAKFPSADDKLDVGLWEKLIHDLAKKAGIEVSESKLWQAKGKAHTFLTKRFDRKGSQRCFFSSAMTLLGYKDGDSASYLEMAEFIANNGDPEFIERDLSQLFRRVIFNIMVANRDDHLRNHGFLRNKTGWVLSPAYDMNLSFDKEDHALAIDTDQVTPDLQLAIKTCPFYRLEKDQAQAIVGEVASVVSTWKDHAKKIKIPRADVMLADGIIKKE